MPQIRPVAPAMASAVTAAAAMARQLPAASSSTGTNRPSCGFSVSRPSRSPASKGRLSRQRSTASMIAAATKANWPEISPKIAAGASSSGASTRHVLGPQPQRRREGDEPERGPQRQSGEIGQRPERRRRQHHARRIGPELVGKAGPGDRRHRRPIGRHVVIARRIGLEGGAPVHPEIDEVAADRKAGAVARDRPAGVERQDVIRNEDEEEQAGRDMIDAQGGGSGRGRGCLSLNVAPSRLSPGLTGV